MISIPKPQPKRKKKPDYKTLYREIWNEREHICQNCGCFIPFPVVHNFSHIGSKGAWPDRKLKHWNIELLCSSVNRPDDQPGCHELSHTNPEAYKQRRK